MDHARDSRVHASRAGVLGCAWQREDEEDGELEVATGVAPSP